MKLDARINRIEFCRNDYFSAIGTVFSKADEGIICGDTTNKFSVDLFWNGLEPKIQNGLWIIQEGCEEYLKSIDALQDNKFINTRIKKISVWNPMMMDNRRTNLIDVVAYSEYLDFRDKEKQFYVPNLNKYLDVEKFFGKMDKHI